MSRTLSDGTTLSTAREARTVWDAESIGAGMTVNGPAMNAEHARRARVVIDAAGADLTVKLQASADGGTDWHDLATYAAGATGAQSIVELCDVEVRLSVTNGSGLNVHTITAYLVLGS